jgi:hypothetical protein
MSRYKRRVSRKSSATPSDFTDHARPLVKSIADTCKDVGVIVGTLCAAYELLSRVLNALL